jgi:hypothetical protein
MLLESEWVMGVSDSSHIVLLQQLSKPFPHSLCVEQLANVRTLALQEIRQEWKDSRL